MSDVQSQQPAAGWYPDPSGQMRWWDGTQWGVYAPPVVTVQRAPGNGAAVASLVLGILGVLTGWMVALWFFSIPLAVVGLVLGIVGYIRAKDINGRGGLVASWGVILCVLPLLILGAAAIWSTVN